MFLGTTLTALFLVAPLWAAESGHTTGVFFGCRPKGEGGDAELSKQKNRDLPPRSYKPTTIATILAEEPAAAAEGKRDRDRWTPDERKEVRRFEATGISVVGYVANVKKLGKEACNCGSTEHVDHHVWLVAKPKQKQSQGMVVEISPRLIEKHPHDASFVVHPDWPALLRKAKRNGDLVRISGWRTWDQEHPEQLKPAKNRGATRATLWEIHPIHKIEVRDADGTWIDIEEAAQHE
jgi:hypothetical protein